MAVRPGPPNGAARARARSGVAPAILIDVQTAAGEYFYFSDRPLRNIVAVLAAADGTLVEYKPWLLSSGSLTFNRSLQTDTGSLTLQNLSGDVLQSDWERLTRRSTFEGALFVLRWYQVDMEWPWLEQHGTLTIGDTSRSTVQLSLQQLLQGQDDTPEQTVSETCQLVWGEKRCGATGDHECLYTYASCQVVERFTGIQTAFETNNPASVADLPVTPINRKRAW